MDASASVLLYFSQDGARFLAYSSAHYGSALKAKDCTVFGINVLFDSVTLIQFHLGYILVHLSDHQHCHRPSLTPAVFHSRHKTDLFHKSYPPQTAGAQPTEQNCLHGVWTVQRFFSVSVSSRYFFSYRLRAVNCQLLTTRKIVS